MAPAPTRGSHGGYLVPVGAGGCAPARHGPVLTRVTQVRRERPQAPETHSLPREWPSVRGQERPGAPPRWESGDQDQRSRPLPDSTAPAGRGRATWDTGECPQHACPPHVTASGTVSPVPWCHHTRGLCLGLGAQLSCQCDSPPLTWLRPAAPRPPPGAEGAGPGARGASPACTPSDRPPPHLPATSRKPAFNKKSFFPRNQPTTSQGEPGQGGLLAGWAGPGHRGTPSLGRLPVGVAPQTGLSEPPSKLKAGRTSHLPTPPRHPEKALRPLPSPVMESRAANRP